MNPMYPKQAKIRVNCQFSGQPEFVYVRSVDTGDVVLAHFAGCDGNYHKCDACEIYCCQKAKQKFSQAFDESRQILWHTL